MGNAASLESKPSKLERKKIQISAPLPYDINDLNDINVTVTEKDGLKRTKSISRMESWREDGDQKKATSSETQLHSNVVDTAMFPVHRSHSSLFRKPLDHRRKSVAKRTLTPATIPEIHDALDRLPPPETLHELYAAVLEDLNLPSEKLEAMRSFSDARQWAVVQMHFKERAASPAADIVDVAAYLSPLQICLNQTTAATEADIQAASSSLRTLAVALRTHPIRWITRFVDEEGLTTLLDYFQFARHVSRAPSDHEYLTLKCVKALMNNPYGLAATLGDRRTLEALMSALRHRHVASDETEINSKRLIRIARQYKTRALVYDLLGAICLLDSVHYRRILRSWSRRAKKQGFGSKQRFFALVADITWRPSWSHENGSPSSSVTNSDDETDFDKKLSSDDEMSSDAWSFHSTPSIVRTESASQDSVQLRTSRRTEQQSSRRAPSSQRTETHSDSLPNDTNDLSLRQARVDVRVAALSFVNALLCTGVAAQDAAFRLQLRQELVQVGLESAIQTLSMEHSILQKQIEIYWSATFQDEQRLMEQLGESVSNADSEQADLSISAARLLKSTVRTIKGTACESSLFTIAARLASLAQLQPAAKRRAFWNALAEVMSDATEFNETDTVETVTASVRETWHSRWPQVAAATRATGTTIQDDVQLLIRFMNAANAEEKQRLLVQVKAIVMRYSGETLNEAMATISAPVAVSNVALPSAHPPPAPPNPPPPPPVPAVATPPPPPPPPPTGKTGAPPPPPPPGPPSPGPPPPPPVPGAPPTAPCAPVAPPNAPPGMKAKPTQRSSVPLKPFQWQKLPVTRISNTIWYEMDEDVVLKKLNTAELEQLFAANDSRAQETAAIKSESPSELSTVPASVIDAKRTQNCSILLKTNKLDANSVIEALQQASEQILNRSLLSELLKFIPTEEDVAQLQSRDFSSLSMIDQFFFRISQCSHYEQRLKAMLFKLTFGENFIDVQQGLLAVRSACEWLQSSSLLKQMLQLILALGNYLNSGARGGAFGFKISSLLKIADTRSTRPQEKQRHTLMHYLVEQVENHFPHLLQMEEFLPSLDAASKVSLLALKATIKQQQSHFPMVRQLLRHLTTDEKSSAFVKSLELFLNESQQQCSSLEAEWNQVEQLYQRTVQLFGEEPQQQEDFFGTFCKFSVAFKQARNDNDQIKIRAIEALKREERQKNLETSKKNRSSIPLLQENISMSPSQPPLDDLISALRSGQAFKKHLQTETFKKKPSNQQIL